MSQQTATTKTNNNPEEGKQRLSQAQTIKVYEQIKEMKAEIVQARMTHQQIADRLNTMLKFENAKVTKWAVKHIAKSAGFDWIVKKGSRPQRSNDFRNRLAVLEKQNEYLRRAVVQLYNLTGEGTSIPDTLYANGDGKWPGGNDPGVLGQSQ